MANIFDPWFEKHVAIQIVTKQNKRGFLSSGIQNDGWGTEEKPLDKIPTAQEVKAEIHATLAQQLASLKEKSRCLYCGHTYTRAANIGRMNCKWHPNPGPSPYTFDCCNQAKGPNASIGCTPCDHTVIVPTLGCSRWNETTQFMNVPLQLAKEFNIPPQNYRIADETSPYLIKAVVKRCEGI